MAPVSARRPAIRYAAAVLLWLVPALSWSLSSDRNQPIEIEADKATLDEGKGLSIYEGNVHLRQGTLHLQGSRLSVYLKNSQVDKLVLSGQPASYSQRLDGEENDQHASAGRIEYLAGKQRMILQGNARIWREETEEFSSDRIVVNLKDNTLDAGGGGPDGRVRIILQPRNWQLDEQTPDQ
jgi:lipopolysaccharide export system protein LptA